MKKLIATLLVCCMLLTQVALIAVADAADQGTDSTVQYALLDKTGKNTVAMGEQAVSGLTAAQAIEKLSACSDAAAAWYQDASGNYLPAFAFNRTQNKLYPYAPWDEAANDLAAILDEASPNDTVLLGTSYEDEELVIEEDVTLDLHGNTLVMDLLFADGNVVDSTDGEGLLIGFTMQLNPENPQFPLYDNEANGHRLYNYYVKSAGTQVRTENTVTFGYRLNFTNEAAYTLLQNSNADTAGLDYRVKLTCNDTVITYVFTPEMIARYADYALSGKTPAFTLTVKGLDNLTAGDVLTTVSTAASPLLVTASGSKNEYTR